MAGHTTKRDEHLKRLRRIECEVRGLQRMVEEDECCSDVLTQVSATTEALQDFALGLLDEHVEHCVTDVTSTGDGQKRLAETIAALNRLVRS